MGVPYHIDYIKSIQKQRLVYKTNLRITWSYMVCYFSAIAVFVMIVAIFGELFLPKPNGMLDIPLLIPLFSIIVLIWMIANLILMNKMVKIYGKERDVNKKDVITILSQYYKLNNLDITDENIIRDIKPYVFILNGRIITCLLEDEKVYLNLTSLQNYNNLSPFNGLYNYYKCKRIAKRFKQLQTNS